MSPQNAIAQAVVKILKTAATKAAGRISRGLPRENEKRPYVVISTSGQVKTATHSGEHEAKINLLVEALTMDDAADIATRCIAALEAADDSPVAIAGFTVNLNSVYTELLGDEETIEEPSTLSQHQERHSVSRSNHTINFTFKAIT